MRKILIAIALASVASLAAAPVDTSLVLKPTAEQIKAAHPVGNKICPVTGDEIGGSMGPGKTVVYKGQAVQLCCGSCVKKFAKDPDKYLSAAQASAKPSKTENAPAQGMKDMPGM
jgi:YHS domain-containing protein